MKVEFLTKLRLEDAEEGYGWVLLEPFVAKIDGETIVVPPGFWTDLDSVPRLPLAYWLAKGRARKSAVLHDYLYTQQFPRKWCDDVMFAAMETEGVGSVYRQMIYAGVRAGGWHAYKNKNRED